MCLAQGGEEQQALLQSQHAELARLQAECHLSLLELQRLQRALSSKDAQLELLQQDKLQLENELELLQQHKRKGDKTINVSTHFHTPTEIQIRPGQCNDMIL